MRYPAEPFEIQKDSYNQYAVADELQHCLESALSEIGVDLTVPKRSPVPGFYPDNIRVNKLSYMAIDNFDLPLIRTWYKYGQYEPYTSLRADRLNLSQLDDGNKVVYDPPYRGKITRSAIYEYFLNHEQLINEIWDYDLYEFMIFNYGRHAPDSLKDLYISNTGILRTLDKFFHNEYTHHKDYSKLKESIMNLRFEIKEQFNQDTSELFRDFLYHLEDAFIKVGESDNISTQQQKILKQAYLLYHNFIWSSPSLDIAVHYTNGPDREAQEYRDMLDNYTEGSFSAYETVIERWKENAKRHNLVPENEFSGVDKPNVVGEIGRAATSVSTNGQR